MKKYVGVGVCLLIIKDKQFLVAERIGKFGTGCLAVPGGHQEKNELWAETALRELQEEAGSNLNVKIRPFSLPTEPTESNVPFFITNNILSHGSHYLTVWLVADWISGVPINAEPHKKNDWFWITLDEIIKHEKLKIGKQFYELGKFHDSLHWIPISEITKHRQQIGL